MPQIIGSIKQLAREHSNPPKPDSDVTVLYPNLCLSHVFASSKCLLLLYIWWDHTLGFSKAKVGGILIFTWLMAKEVPHPYFVIECIIL